MGMSDLPSRPRDGLRIHFRILGQDVEARLRGNRDDAGEGRPGGAVSSYLGLLAANLSALEHPDCADPPEWRALLRAVLLAETIRCHRQLALPLSGRGLLWEEWTALHHVRCRTAGSIHGWVETEIPLVAREIVATVPPLHPAVSRRLRGLRRADPVGAAIEEADTWQILCDAGEVSPAESGCRQAQLLSAALSASGAGPDRVTSILWRQRWLVAAGMDPLASRDIIDTLDRALAGSPDAVVEVERLRHEGGQELGG